MTQQLDLALNTATSMDKMMNSSSFSLKDSKSSTEFESQFSSYLNSANKSFENNTTTNTSTNTNTNNTTISKNDNKSLNDTKENKTNIQTKEQNDYSNNKDLENSNKTDFSEEKTEVIETVSKNNLETVATIPTEDFSQDVLDEQTMNEILQDSMLTANLTNIPVVSKEDVVKLEQSLTMDFDNADISTEAVKTGVQFENIELSVDISDEISKNTDLTSVNTTSVDELTKDITVSTDDLINAMYQSKTAKIDNTEIAQKTIKTDNKDTEKITETVTENLTSNNKDLNTENIISDTKTESKFELPKISKDGKLKVESENEMSQTKNSTPESINLSNQNDTLEENIDLTKIAYNNDTKKVDLKDEKKIDNKIDLDINKKEKVDLSDSKNIDLKDQKENISENLKNLDKKNIQTVDLSNNNNEDVVQTKIEDVVSTINTTDTVKVDTSLKTEISENKVENFKEEFSSAELENSINQATTNLSDKKVADKNAKTNVNADETIDVKEDVSGIEFKDVKTPEKTVDDKVQDKISTQVENVKMQVEEDVKIVPQQQEIVDNSKVQKANETLEKAGLSTENLKKMDGKIKEIDYSQEQNPQTDLGQSSQEMMMRDMMQTSDTSNLQNDTKVDFTQALSKATKTTMEQTQAQQDTQEIDVLEQIRTRLNVSGKNGLQKISIGLTPESLGKLHIEIAKGQNGISAQILAENPQAKEILEKNLDGLKSVLQSQGVNVNNVNVKIAETEKSSDSNNNMFQNENGEFNSNDRGGNSQNSDESNKEKRSEFEFIQNTVLQKETLESSETSTNGLPQVEKTISINGGNGKVNYKM